MIPSSYTLEAYLAAAGEVDDAHIMLRAKGLQPPKMLENLRRLQRLGLLTDEVVFSLLGQAPIDPLGVFGALKNLGGVWAFQPLDFTAVQVLAKRKALPIALMRVDLLSDDIIFVALKAGQLVEHSRLTADELEARMRVKGTTEKTFLEWLNHYIQAAVTAGRAGT